MTSYTFECYNGEGKSIKMLLSFCEHERLSSISCTFNYHKYLFREENSSIIHYKYYKSCLMTSNSCVPTCSIEENTITLSINDQSADEQSVVKLVLHKQERDSKEKIDIMFEVMMNEIRELKEVLWYADKQKNKFSEKYISNWQNLLGLYNPNDVIITKTKDLGTPPSSEVNISGVRQTAQSVQVKPMGLAIVNQSVLVYQVDYSEESLEPIVMYFKHPVEFCGIEFTIYDNKVMDGQDFKAKVFVYGVMKPEGVIRTNGTTTHDKKSEMFIMPSLTLLREQEFNNKQVSITFESMRPYDGLGIAVRFKQLTASNQQIIHTYQYSDYQLSKVKIF